MLLMLTTVLYRNQHSDNRGTGYQSAIVTIAGNGFGEELQIGNTMKISGLSLVPGPGANVRFTGSDVQFIDWLK